MWLKIHGVLSAQFIKLDAIHKAAEKYVNFNTAPWHAIVYG